MGFTAKVRGDTFSQVLGFTDIKHIAFGVEHPIATRTVRQGFKKGLTVESFAHRQLAFFIEQLTRPFENSKKHGVGQAAGLGVVTTAVVRR